MADGYRFDLEFPDGFDRWTFSRKFLRTVMRNVGKDLTANTKRILNRGGKSRAGEPPVKMRGAYAKSVIYRVSRAGMSVGVSPTRKTLLRALVSGLPTDARKNYALKAFYPAMLIKSRTSPVAAALDKRRESYKRYFAEQLTKAIQKGKASATDSNH